VASGPVCCPVSAATAQGRYSSSPDSAKKMGTPTSPRLIAQDSGVPVSVYPVSPPMWVSSTAPAAAARRPSSESWCQRPCADVMASTLTVERVIVSTQITEK